MPSVIQDPFVTTERDEQDPVRDRSIKESMEENLLTLDEEEAAKRVYMDWEEGTDLIKGLRAQWTANRLRRKGFTGVTVVKAQDENRVHVPRGATPMVAGFNKAARLVRRVAATMFADKAVPDPVPSGNDDKARDSAIFSEKVLLDLDSEGKVDNNRTHRRAFDRASDFGSGFIHYRVDEFGGGRGPLMIMAAPEATDPEQPTMVPMEVADEAGLPTVVLQPFAGELVVRYVTEDGQITDEPREAKQVWYPKLVREIYDGRHVRLHPLTSQDIWEAEGATIAEMVPLGLLKKQFKEIGEMEEEELSRVLDARSDKLKDLLPPAKRRKFERLRGDERLALTLTRYQKQTPEYPEGAYLIVIGPGVKLLFRDKWNDPSTGEILDIPISQVKQMDEEDEHGYGNGIMTPLGPGNEVIYGMIEAMMDHLDRFRHRKTYVPVTSNIQAKQLQSAQGIIPIVPGGQPVHEEVPDFPRMVEKFLAFAVDDADDESGLQEAGQGLEAPNVTSGKQQQAIVAQVIIGLSSFRENILRAFQRSWRIQLQLIRAHFDVPQLVDWSTEDGQYQAKLWVGSDLQGVKDVQVLRGSFTQLHPAQKDAMISQWLSEQRITPEEAKRLGRSQVGAYMGMEEDKQVQRIRRQISRWSDGAPAGYQPPQVDPQTGQALPDRVALGLFDPNPVDDLPPIALTRADELAQFMSTVAFERHQPPWKQVMVNEFNRARLAAGLLTLAEQQALAAQQAQEQAQAQAAARQQEAVGEARKEAREDQRRAEDRQDRAIDRATGARSEERAVQAQLEAAAIRANAAGRQAADQAV